MTRLRTPALLILPLFALGAGRALAATGDAGTQSYFASGTGARALGMGSAFVAAADDATSLFWNPAGLAAARRIEFQALQWSDSELGFRETSASFVIPDWRWGALGASFRLFGVGGIERRDAANQLLDDGLSDTEVEAALGYARPVGEAWEVGGSLKLVRHDLAGFSAGGVGADLGVRVKPARWFGATGHRFDGMTWGLALRNAVEPTLRLDSENVPDPASLRGGVAWTFPTAGLGHLTATLDLEKAGDIRPRMRGGFEWLPLSGIAMRGGFLSTGMTAGAGFAWSDWGVDYVFEDSPIEARHRVGLTWKLGHTTEERRLSALAAEDARLQQQMAAAHQRTLDDLTGGLVDRVESARAAGQYDAALEAVGLLSTVAPDHPDRARLEQACLLDRASQLEQSGDFAGASVSYERAHALAPDDSAAAAGSARCLNQIRQRASRSSERQQLYAAALSAFAADDLATARARLNRLLSLEPGDADGLALLAWTRQAIQGRVARTLEQADRLLAAGLIADAEAALRQARDLDPSASGIARLASALERRRGTPAGTAAGSAPRGAPVAARASALSGAELASLYDRALEALREQRSEEAIRFLDLVWTERPDYREAGPLLKRELLARGLALFAGGRLEEAVAQWSRALQVDPADPRIRGYLERAQKELARSREILGTRSTP